jgi:hypothetical protein
MKAAAALEFVWQTEGWGRIATDGTGMSVSVRVLGEVAIAYDRIALPLPESLRVVALLGWLAVHAGSRTRSESHRRGGRTCPTPSEDVWMSLYDALRHPLMPRIG